jgi:hypothetical protein
MSSFCRFVLVAVVVLNATLLAANVVLPTDLAPGSPYQLVFVTSGSRDSLSADINDYNAFVAAQATSSVSSVVQGATWKAIMSTPTVNAVDNAPTYSDVPIYNTHGDRVANNSADLWDGSIRNPIQYNENGELYTDSSVWTNTYYDGTAEFWGGSFVQTTGLATSWGKGSWIRNSGRNTGIIGFDGSYHPFYALSSPITTAPEPTTLALLCTAVLAHGGILFLRRRWAFLGRIC